MKVPQLHHKRQLYTQAGESDKSNKMQTYKPPMEIVQVKAFTFENNFSFQDTLTSLKA
jgi:hypothetical protein